MGNMVNPIRLAFLEACASLQCGALELHLPDGSLRSFGEGSTPVAVVLHDWRAIAEWAARGEVGLGEAYVAGLWDCDDLAAFAQIRARNRDLFDGFATVGPFRTLSYQMLRKLGGAGPLAGIEREMRQHFSVGNEFYQLWLDRGMGHAAARFDGAEAASLEQVQQAHYQALLARLPDVGSMLELGCGWGGFTEAAAQAGHQVTALTMAPGQKGYADARLDGRAEVHLTDFEKVGGHFGAIISLEAVERLGEAGWPGFFATINQRLAPGGVALVQTVTVPDAYFDLARPGHDFTTHYPMRGGRCMSDAVIAGQLEQAGLQEVRRQQFGADYARLLSLWSERLEAARPGLVRLGLSDRFYRAWQFALTLREAAFAAGLADVVLLELTHG